jgi:alpha-ketoglutarate-dependent taurine dioxygenase
VSDASELDEITYIASATEFRRALLNLFGRPDYDPSAQIAANEDTCLTYRGYIKFLDTDLQTVYPVGPERSRSRYKKAVEFIAKRMLSRGDAFARAVREKFPDHVRLSIHPSTPGSNKMSISPLPTDSPVYTTPWHCAMGVRTNGTVTSGPRSEFEAAPETWELILDAAERPSYFRERFPASQQNLYAVTGAAVPITVEPLYPSGLLIRPTVGPFAAGMADLDSIRLRALSEHNSPVILRGFRGTTDRDAYVAKAHELGTPTPWKFGLVLEVKDRGEDARGLNNVLSSEWMPWHYDGLFKTVTRRCEPDGLEEIVSTPPQFQFFTAVTSSPKDTGFTLFASSPVVFRYLAERLGAEVDAVSFLRGHTWRVATGAFDNTTLTRLPMVVDHPTTGAPCIRFHEPWPQSKTAFTPTIVEVEDVASESSEALCRAITATLHDRRVALWHTWEKGDLCVSDNVLTLHTRSDFTAGCDRELWRIHFN